MSENSETGAHPEVDSEDRSRYFHRALGFAVLLHFVWIVAWIMEQSLETQTDFLSTRESRFVYWNIAKLLLWVLPAIVLIRASGQTFSGVMAFNRVRAILAWGGGIGIALGSTAIIPKTLDRQPLIPSHFDLSFFSGVIIAPIVEEIVFRGVILEQFSTRFRFAVANIITSLLFVSIHMVGWSFQGRLLENLTMPVGGALSIFFISLILGFVARKSRSVAASTLTHILNNLCSA